MISAACAWPSPAPRRSGTRPSESFGKCTRSGSWARATVSAHSHGPHVVSSRANAPKGLTETSVVVCTPHIVDEYPRGCGSLMPGIRAKLIDASGREVTEHETRGELYLQGPNLSLGYLNNTKATSETFVHDADGRWIRTGDEALIAVSEKGNEQIVIMDRIKELIKVKVCQVPYSSKGSC